jgi:hypothetical protein
MRTKPPSMYMPSRQTVPMLLRATRVGKCVMIRKCTCVVLAGMRPTQCVQVCAVGNSAVAYLDK